MGRWGIDPMNHNTPPNTGRRVVILTEAQTYLNPCVLHIVIVLYIREHPYPNLVKNYDNVTVHCLTRLTSPLVNPKLEMSPFGDISTISIIIHV
jgi:hypothetical protein